MKARRLYKCECCGDVIAKKGEEIDDICETWVAYDNVKTLVFCSVDCAARWHCDEEDLVTIQEGW